MGHWTENNDALKQRIAERIEKYGSYEEYLRKEKGVVFRKDLKPDERVFCASGVNATAKERGAKCGMYEWSALNKAGKPFFVVLFDLIKGYSRKKRQELIMKALDPEALKERLQTKRAKKSTK